MAEITVREVLGHYIIADEAEVRVIRLNIDNGHVEI